MFSNFLVLARYCNFSSYIPQEHFRHSANILSFRSLAAFARPASVSPMVSTQKSLFAYTIRIHRIQSQNCLNAAHSHSCNLDFINLKRHQVTRGSENLALPSIAVAVSGAIWGLYWIPIRELDVSGVPPHWTTLFSFGSIGVLAAGAFIVQWYRTGRIPWSAISTGLISGLAVICYATALVLTDVVKTILLFYLLPVWSTLLGKLILKEKITWQRLSAVVLGLVGLAVILDASGGIPKPSNAGDWLALSSGLLWSWASIKIRQDDKVTAWEQVGAFYIGGGLTSLVVIALPFGIFGASPDYDSIIRSTPWLLIFVGVYLPSMFLIFWGTQRLSPARSGILLMTEIIFGIASAALLTDEAFGWKQIIGVVLITSAALVELSGKIEMKNDNEQ